MDPNRIGTSWRRTFLENVHTGTVLPCTPIERWFLEKMFPGVYRLFEGETQ
jgi:hypothetical protein